MLASEGEGSLRDSLLLLLLLGTVIIGFTKVSEWRSTFPKLAEFPKTQRSEWVQLGGRNGQRKNRTNHGEDSTQSDEVAGSGHPNQEPPSIYSGESDSEDTIAQNSEKPAAEATHASKVLGVPIDRWLRSRKNSLALNVVPEQAHLGLRVFLWCMELKEKRVEYLSEGECQKLRLQSPFDKTVSVE